MGLFGRRDRQETTGDIWERELGVPAGPSYEEKIERGPVRRAERALDGLEPKKRNKAYTYAFAAICVVAVLSVALAAYATVSTLAGRTASSSSASSASSSSASSASSSSASSASSAVSAGKALEKYFVGIDKLAFLDDETKALLASAAKEWLKGQGYADDEYANVYSDFVEAGGVYTFYFVTTTDLRYVRVSYDVQNRAFSFESCEKPQFLIDRENEQAAAQQAAAEQAAASNSDTRGYATYSATDVDGLKGVMPAKAAETLASSVEVYCGTRSFPILADRTVVNAATLKTDESGNVTAQVGVVGTNYETRVINAVWNAADETFAISFAE